MWSHSTLSLFDLLHLARHHLGPFTLSQMVGFSCFFYDWIISHFIYILQLLYPSIDGEAGCFQVLVIVNNAAMNMRVQVSFQVSVFITFQYILRSAVTAPYGRSIFNFLRILHTIFPSGCTNLQSHQQCPFLHIHGSIHYLSFWWWSL